MILNRIMDLQGGIVTCQAAGILQIAATEDLGLPLGMSPLHINLQMKKKSCLMPKG